MPPKTSSDRRQVGIRIRDARKKADMTAKELADKAGISPSYLSEVEQGESAISSEKLLRIARVLAVNIRYLLDGSGPPSPQDSEIRIPTPLSELAQDLDLSYGETVALLHGRQSLIAMRSSATRQDWSKDDWRKFYTQVKELMEK